MKKLVLVVLTALLSLGSFAQDFENGGNYVTVGYGVDPWGFPYTGVGTYKKVGIGPIMATYERGITDVLGIGRIGVGGGIAQSFYTQKYKYNDAFYGVTTEDVYRTSRTSFIARGAYHFEFGVDKMDVYAGVGAGIHYYSKREKYYDYSVSGYVENTRTSVAVREHVFAGIRYYFTDAFGVYAEAGYGVSALNGGIVFKF